MITISTDYIRNMILPRPFDMHKGQAGRVLIIAGSRGMAGAAVLALRGALYSGAGLVKALVPGELFNIIQTTVPEAMCMDREELCRTSPESLNRCFEEFDAIAIGPGLGVGEENHRLIKALMESYRGPIVLDADALNCIAEFGFCSHHEGNLVMTPHPGEADRLLKACATGCNSQTETVKSLGRNKAVTLLAEKYGAVILLKGAETLIAGEGHNGDKGDSEIYLNPTGNPGMATGGSGDVLTGIITSFLAQKHLALSPVKAACAGAYIHGLAGDIAAENIGEYGMTAADIADAISMAIKELTAH